MEIRVNLLSWLCTMFVLQLRNKDCTWCYKGRFPTLHFSKTGFLCKFKKLLLLKRIKVQHKFLTAEDWKYLKIVNSFCCFEHWLFLSINSLLLGHSMKKDKLFSHSVISRLCNPMDYSIPGFPLPSLSPSLLKLIHWVRTPSNISFSLVPFSSCLQSFPALGSYSNWLICHIQFLY